MVEKQAGKTREKFPIVITAGAASVKIYRVKTGTGGAYQSFAVADYGSGKRRLRKFSDLKTAKAEAQRIAIALGNLDGKVASLDYRDAASLVRLQEKILPLGISIESAADLVAESAGLVGVHRIVEACREFAARHPAAREKISLAKAADDYYAARANQRRSPRHLEDIASRLGRFVHEHPGRNLRDLTSPTIQSWLDGLRGTTGASLSPMSRKNFAKILYGFFEHRRQRGEIYENPVRDVERELIKSKGDVVFYTPEEVVKILAAAPVELAPALAIAFFAGLRTAELCRLTWGDVSFEQAHISIGRDKSKTASRRLVPILPNLREWLLPHRGDATTPVWPQPSWDFHRTVTETCTAAGVRRINNGTRHSFVTYRVAETGDVARAALEAGNSPQMIFKHYRGLATQETAEKFFNVRPHAAGQAVIPFKARP